MKQKIKTILFIGLALIALFGMTGCPQTAEPEEPPSPPHKVTFSVDGTPANGTLKATAGTTEITSGSKIAHGTTVTFTATPNTDYMVDTWTVTPSAALQEGGTEGSTMAKVKITEATTVKVSFTKYKKAAYGTNGDDLKNYLTTASPASDGICYIEVTGLTAADLEGTASRPSPLGKILKDNPAKKVSLKLPKTVEGLTDMRYCFNRCENLVNAAVIPENVTNMNNCFLGCTSLTQISALPQSVKYIIGCFQGCTSLEKAPAIPASVTEMKRCFTGCTSLTEAPAIPEGVTNISGCFGGCTSFENAPAIPKSVTNMNNCFSRCTNLTEAPTIPESVEDIEGCFFGCTNLENAPAIPESVKAISICFSGCTKLTQGPAIPKNTEFMVMCFQNCTNLTSVTLKCNYGDGGKFGNAFQNCTALGEKSIKVPQAYYDAYTTAEALNSMAVPGATEAEKKAKFEGVAELNP